ncbi:alpha/beta hydrolase [Skermania sp. ID1734]|nr:alpha/beta hydrolase [Skermania sp. ID1734]
MLATPSTEPEVIPVTTADGAQLRVHAYGPVDGDPIVFSHGWTCSIEYWYPQINALSEKYRVIAYDQRGHGKSEMGEREPGADVLGDDLAAVIAAAVAPRRKALIVGHSMGGMTIMAWASRHPKQAERKASAVLLANTGADHLVSETKLVPLPAFAAFAKDAVAGVVLGAPVPLPGGAMTRGIFRNRVMSPTSSRRQVEFAQRIILACKGRVRAQWGLALAKFDLLDGLANLNVPVSVIGGSIDKLTPPQHSERLVAELERNGNLDRFLMIEGVGHLANIEAIDQFNAEVIRLRSLGKRGRRSRAGLAVVAS